MGNRMKVLIGLGNPEAEYEGSRHNAGFDVLDALAAQLGTPFEMDSEALGLVARPDTNVLLVKPQPGMNDSGKCLRALVERRGISPASMLVVYDELALPLGAVRFAHPGGGDAGHRGIKSILSELADRSNFARLRMGVGPFPKDALNKKLFVTKPMAADVVDTYKKVVDRLGQACAIWLVSTLDACMNRYNGLDLRV